MIFFWILLISLSGFLMAFTHHFRWGAIEIAPSWWTFLLSSIGIAVFMKVSSLRGRKRTRFGLGFLGGFIYFSITLYWISIALREFGGINPILAVLAAFLLAGYCALFYGCWSLLAGFERVREKPIFLRIFLWSSLWAGLEALREYLFTGFTWGEIGYVFSEWPMLGKMASVYGVHGLSFFWIFIVSMLLHLDEWTYSTRQRLKGASIVLLFLGFGLAGSWWTSLKQGQMDIKVALIQPNVSQALKWDPQSASQNLRNLLDLSQRALDHQPDLIVWPETAYPFLIAEGQRQLPISTPVPTLIGAVVSNRQVNFNSALLLQGDQIQNRFDKIHLVPFGEYVPFEDFLPFGKIVENVGRFVPGSKDQSLFHLESGAILGPLICYEDIFSRHSVRLVKKGANLLVNITNDAWYGQSSAQKQHSAIARMRVFETGTPMIRATNNGHTAIFDFNGQRTSLEMEKIDTLVGSLRLVGPDPSSFYVMAFPWMQWIWWLIFVIALAWKVPYQQKKIFFRETSS